MAEKKSVEQIYNPHQQEPQELINSFVVRLHKFRQLYKEISEAKMETPEQHLLIVGQRGMGKTTLLLRLSFEVERDQAVNSWLIPLVFTEEQYGITALFGLWEQVASYLEDKHGEFAGLFDQMDAQYTENHELYERTCFDLLSSALQKNEKKVLLFIDNIGDILSKFTKQESQRLRERLQTSSDIRIIGASASMLESFFDYSEPFFEFFKLIRLEGLDKAEMQTLLLNLGEHYEEPAIREIIENDPGRVEALRRLTGGVIRTIVLLFEIFVDNQNGDAFQDLQKILDRVTPLYKHRMDDLPVQQQQIVDVIAHAWDAVATKEIAAKTRLESKKVSAQLKQLQQNGIVDIIPTDTKNHIYQLKERFFNIWYLMRHGMRYDKQRVVWLTRFLEGWCDHIHTAQPFLFVDGLRDEQHEAHIGSLLLLLAKGQYPLLLEYFEGEKGKKIHAKDRLKPVWYALMYYMQAEYPVEYLRMGSELKETVEEIIAKVEQMRVDYA